MIPLRAENPRRSLPVANVLLIALNVIIFVYQASMPPRAAQALVNNLGVVSARVGSVLKVPPPRLDSELLEASVLPLLTSMFLHGGWLHLLGNMLFLWVFGGSVEDRLGHLGYLVFYLFCGVASAIIHVLMNWGSPVPSVGASGAISGIMGAYIILFPLSRILTLVPVLIIFFTVRLPALLLLGYWFLIQFLSGMSTLGHLNQGGVAWWAHIGGFAIGAVAGLMMRIDSALSRA